MSETLARRIFEKAIAEGRSAELLNVLFDGGSATVDGAGKLVIVTRSQLAGLIAPLASPS